MKKHLTPCCLILSVIFLLAGCGVNFPPMKDYYGTLESDDPHIIITMYGDRKENVGELILDDGTNKKIVIVTMHGSFCIFEYNEEGNYGTDSIMLYNGTYSVGMNKIILKTDDGKKIVLKERK